MVQNEHLSVFMLKLKESGYNERFRAEIIASAKKAYKILVDQDNQGTKPLYRMRSEMLNDKKLKGKNGQNWWSKCKSGKSFTSILFVPPTPNGGLAKLLRIREKSLNENSDMRIKIVEKGGIKIKNLLVKADPFPKAICASEKCPFCQAQPQLSVKTRKNFTCTTPNVGYSIQCLHCNATYEGETARIARSRAQEHLNDLKQEKASSPLVKHLKVHHSQEEPKFQIKITGKFFDALSRQADEAVRIKSSAKASDNFMNSKSEFNSAPVRRLAVANSHSQIHSSGHRSIS